MRVENRFFISFLACSPLTQNIYKLKTKNQLSQFQQNFDAEMKKQFSLLPPSQFQRFLFYCQAVSSNCLGPQMLIWLGISQWFCITKTGQVCRRLWELVGWCVQPWQLLRNKATWPCCVLCRSLWNTDLWWPFISYPSQVAVVLVSVAKGPEPSQIVTCKFSQKHEKLH